MRTQHPFHLITWLFLSLIALATTTARAATVDDFQDRLFVDSLGGQLPYRLFVPVNLEPGRLYPVVLYLHPLGAEGTDNRQQLEGWEPVFVSLENQTNNPCFMVAPQRPVANGWSDVPIQLRLLELLDHLGVEFGIDTNRLYITGMSLGAFGTWAMIEQHPEVFAASVTLAGQGVPELAPLMTGIPIWNFHAADDTTVNVSNSRDMISALRKAGGNPIYTEYQTGGHGIFFAGYQTPDLVEWMMAQKRGVPATHPPRIVVTGSVQSNDPSGATLQLSGWATNGAFPVTSVGWSTDVNRTGTGVGTTNWTAPGIPLRTGFDNLITVIGTGPSRFDPFGGNTTFNTTFRIFVPPCAAPPSGLVNWWPGENDAKGALSGNAGTLLGGATFAPAKAGFGFRFNGTDAGIRIPANTNLDLASRPGLTVEAWINPSTPALPQPLLEWNDGLGTAGVSWWLAADASLSGTGPGSLFADLVDTSGLSHRITTAPGVVSAGTFQHIAVTYDKASGVATLYLNGQPAASSSLGSFSLRTSSDLHLGQRTAGVLAGATFSGILDEVALFDRALTGQEIQAIHAAGATGKCPPPPAPVVYRSHPQSQTVVQGDTVSLAVVVDGTPPFSYRWRRNGATVLNTATISGQGTPLLTLSNIQPAQAGNYDVVVTNRVTFTGRSQTAALTVLADTDGDRLPDAWETLYNFDPHNPANGTADPDGDGLNNRQEFIAGTNPTNALSYLKLEAVLSATGNPSTLLRFLAVSNKTYTIEFRDPNTAAAWTRLTDIDAATADRPVEFADPVTPANSQRLYHLVTPRLP